MLILTVCSIYMLVGVLYTMWVFHTIRKWTPNEYEDAIRRFGSLSFQSRFSALAVIVLKWPVYAYIDITNVLHRLIAIYRIHLIDKELERRKRNES